MTPIRASRLRRATAIGCLGLGLSMLGAGGGASAQESSVLVTRVDGTITPVIADHIEDVVGEAERGGYEALVVELDTPGGLDTAMRDIVQAFMGSRVPVVVHVSPSGARAASAGALITMSANVAAMAPGTTIGAATPVALQGGEVGDKVVNDAASYSEAIAEERGRDTRFARRAVTEGESVTDRQALERGVVDLVVEGRGDLLEQVDGMEVTVAGGRTVTIATAGASVEERDLGTLRSILQWLADPNLAFLFISIGTLALIYEFANPGVGAGGIVGAIMLVLAFFSLSVLPVNVAGALLMLLAFALFVAELFVPGIGVMAGGGVVSLVLGGILLFRGSMEVDAWVLWPTAAVVGGGAVLITRFAWRSRSAVPTSGVETLVGREARVRSVTEDGEAQAVVEGARWRLRRADGEPLAPGDEVRVVAVEGLDLIVEPAGRHVPVGEEEA